MADERTSMKDHWTQIWSTTDPTRVSWYEDRPDLSLELIEQTGFSPENSIIDVGAGRSRLTQALLAAGFTDLGVVDIAEPAVSALKQNLDPSGADVSFYVDDVRTFRSQRTWDIWHDRAVFHFLTDDEERAQYADALEANLAPGGYAIIATFAPDGPEMCSGLPVRRSSGQDLDSFLGDWTELVDERHTLHPKPAGGEQAFCYALLQRTR